MKKGDLVYVNVSGSKTHWGLARIQEELPPNCFKVYFVKDKRYAMVRADQCKPPKESDKHGTQEDFSF